MASSRNRRGLSLVEALVALAAAALLLSVTLPVLARGADSRYRMGSQMNLRILGAAHAIYAADWNGRQLTFVDDFIAAYGSNPVRAFPEYWEQNGFRHPGVKLGWGRLPSDPDPRWLEYRTGQNCANAMLTLPIEFTGSGCNPGLAYFGAFRLHNARQFNQYVGGRFYDEIFYAPEDTVVFEAVDRGGCFDDRDQYCGFADVCDDVGTIPAWSSYCLSPAAMFDPAVFAHDDPEDDEFNGWFDPWNLVDGFRSPGAAQALYPHLKTKMLEHHWLRTFEEQCNPGFDPGTYGYEDDCCEPYYFNHGLASSPMTLFYDGHVAAINVADAMADDAVVREQNENENWGLWSKDTPWGEDGYLTLYGYDRAETSFHILTTDGILGRDILEPGGLRPDLHASAPTRLDRPARRRGPADPTLPAIKPSLTE